MKTEVRSIVIVLLLLMAGWFPARACSQSLINPETFRGPAADRRAYRVGDVLTVYVSEASRARSQAGTNTDQGADIGIGLHSPSTSYDASLSLRGKNAGTAETRRIGELRAQLSVRVVAVESNGLLHIRGAQILMVNGEQQRINVSGVVRPEDIAAGNVVWSSRLADADVSLAGAGIVSEAQKRSLVSRIFHWLGLL